MRVIIPLYLQRCLFVCVVIAFLGVMVSSVGLGGCLLMRLFGLLIVSVLFDLPYTTFIFYHLISVVLYICFPFICQKGVIFNATEEATAKSQLIQEARVTVTRQVIFALFLVCY